MVPLSTIEQSESYLTKTEKESLHSLGYNITGLTPSESNNALSHRIKKSFEFGVSIRDTNELGQSKGVLDRDGN